MQASLFPGSITRRTRFEKWASAHSLDHGWAREVSHPNLRQSETPLQKSSRHKLYILVQIVAAKVFFDPACSSVTVLLRSETSKISTTESVREAGEWYWVAFYCLNSETSESLILQLVPRAKYGFWIHFYCNLSSEFCNVRASKIKITAELLDRKPRTGGSVG